MQGARPKNLASFMTSRAFFASFAIKSFPIAAALRASFFAFKLVEGFHHSVDICIENQWSTLLRNKRSNIFFVRRAGKQIPTVKFQRELWIFQNVSRKDQDNGLIWSDKALLDQPLQSRERNRRSRFAADAIRTNLGFCQSNFDFAHLLNRTTGGPNHA